ncbi:predicted protein [Nematostella vectensis]|uniref:Uncharacterized protein n=1 Tax=Nematostella vectensis TaxID=45351 RepID=A7RNT2_NEMVE|nr:predicted protein [Nematostella vectensis]|eukprot:XP_001638970.1 predicted protein [Nematostella vectensis]
MADLEAEAEQFLEEDGSDIPLSTERKRPLASMLKRKNLPMYLQFVFFGIGSVLPVFVIFAAVDYFDVIFPSKEPEFALNVIYNPLLFCGSFVNLVWGRGSSFKWRIVSGFSVMAVSMVAFIALDQLELCGATCLKTHYWSVLLVAGILGLADAVCQSTLFGLTSHALPPLYTQGLMFGASICGGIITILRIVTKSTTSSMHLSSYYYFGATSVFIALVIILFIRLMSGSAFQRYYSRAARYSLDKDLRHPIRRLVGFTIEALKVLSYKRVFCYCFLLMLIHLQQFMVMPSVVTMANDFLGHGWYPVLLVLVYNIGDVIGRGPLAMYYTYNLGWAWLSTFVRFSLVIGICLSVPPYMLSRKPAWMATFVGLLGLSTGHLSTSLMSQASVDVPGRAKETVGYLGVLSMTLGMAGGSALSLGLKALIERVN